MNSKTRLVVNYGEVGLLLKSNIMEEATAQVAEELASACGDGYVAEGHAMSQRIIYSVMTESLDAMRDNEKNNTLLKNLKGK